MNTTSRTILCLGFIALLQASGVGAEVDNTVRLPRLGVYGKRSLSASHFTSDPLLANDAIGVTKKSKKNVEYLSLNAETRWARSLRGNPLESLAVSFLVLASESTIIEVGGARLGFAGSIVTGSVQLMYDSSSVGSPGWKSLGLFMPVNKFADQTLASPPLLTIYLNQGAGVWHIYAGNRLLADNLPLAAPKAEGRSFSVRAGIDGAWICNLIQADENPLFIDDNSNGIDDAFEERHLGSLLARSAPMVEQEALAEDWRRSQRTSSWPFALVVTRPSPDRD